MESPERTYVEGHKHTYPRYVLLQSYHLIKYLILLFIYIFARVAIGFLVRLIPVAVVAVAMIVFFIGILLLDPVLSLAGFSEQEIAATMGITVLIGIWIVAISLYFRFRNSNDENEDENGDENETPVGSLQ